MDTTFTGKGFMVSALMLLVIIVGVSSPSYGASQYNFSCSSCHGMPPADGPTRKPSDGSFPGNHQTHQPASAQIADCSKCHVVTGFTTGHLDGKIGFSSSLNNSPVTSQYKVGGTAVSFRNQTSVPAYGNCTNANCHFESATPVWGSARYGSTSDCSACHTSPGSSAPHAKHDLYFTGTSGCIKCHPDWATGLKFSHATSAGRRGIQVTMGEGSYSGNGLNFLPSQSASRVTGSCSAIYCHSPGDKASAYNAPLLPPSWNGTLNCLGCHKGDVASGNAINTPASGFGHTKHVNPGIAAQIACIKCHAATVSSNGVIQNRAEHVDKFVTIKFSSSTTAVNGTYNGSNASSAAYRKVPGSAYGTCQNVYCHSSGTTASAPFKVMSTPRWGSALPANCTACHGGDSANSARYRIMSTGRHQKHMRGTNFAAANTYYNYGCADCHNSTVSGNTTISNKANHVNYKIDVSMAANWGGSYASSGHAPGVDSTRTCATVYCHSNGQAGAAQSFRNLTGAKTWWGNGTIGCSGCHGYGSTSTSLSGKHAAHVNLTANPAIGTAYGCPDCHVKTRAVGSGWSDRNKHVNKFVDYSGIRAGGQARLNISTGECSNVYCHSDGKGGYKSMATNNWFTANSLDCTGCHGSDAVPGFASKAGEPNYVSQGSGLYKANSHSKHVASASDCVKCHRLTTQTGTAIRTGSVDHADGTIDARFSKVTAFATMSGVYNQAAKTCSATYCHGSAASPAWGNTTGTKCNSCHANQGTGVQTIVFNGAHEKHSVWENAGRYNFACETCHSTRAASPATHAGGPVSANQAAEVVFYNGIYANWTSTSYGDESAKRYRYRALNVSPYGAAAPVPAYTAGGTSAGTDNGMSWTSGTCSAVWCHSNANPTGGTNSYQASLAWNSAITCASCHGSTGTTGGTGLSAVHGRHINTFGYTCDKCHVNTVAAGSISALNATTGVATHVDGVKNVNFDSYNAGSSYASFTCSTNYCHSDGKGGYNNSVAWNNAATGACGTCHKASAASAGGLINTKAHFAHFSTSANAYGPMFTAANDTKCGQCHAYTAETASTHVNRTVDVTSTCTSNCHRQIAPANITTAWGGGAVSCESCHTGALSVINFTAPDKSSFSTAGHGKIGAGLAGKVCLDCHDRNQRHITGKPLGYTNRTLAGLGNGTSNTACTFCHNNAAKVTNPLFRNMSTHFLALGGGQAMTCRSCHDPHGASGNLSMIRGKIVFGASSSTIAYTNISTGMINSSTNRGLCQVCHTLTKYYKAGVTETGHPTKNCYSCHSHNAKGGAFKPSGSCDTCHGYPPVPRQVLTAFTFGRLGNYSSARFEDYSGGGGAHVVEAHVAKTVKASDGWAPCLTCHTNGNADHKMTTPVRNNVTNVTVKIDQKYKKYNATQFISYTGAKFVNPPLRNTTGSCYNSSCHFKPSPRWSTER